MPDDTQQAIPTVPSPATGGEPQEHHMHLLGRYYRQVEAGRKTIEVRVATSQKRAVAVGDTVVFHDRDTGRELDNIVQRITPYPSFEDLLSSEDTMRIDPDGPPGELLANLRSIYPPAKEVLGVLALAFDHRPARPGRPMPMTPTQYAQTVPHHTVYGCLYIRDEHDRPVQLRSVYGSRLWQFPGGNLDAAGEDPLQTARREAVEETGLELDRKTPKLLLTHFLHAGPPAAEQGGAHLRRRPADRRPARPNPPRSRRARHVGRPPPRHLAGADGAAHPSSVRSCAACVPWG
ncbi:NUDIX domain-containing protein [Streptomyces nigra]|uniref:NUDIX domain-containing protein n=1 Tax=Streptomyces nigra TaxID=1827580 RepID=UPI0036BD39CA